MPRQAMNTIYSLSSQHQKNVSPESYEILVMENSSENNLDQKKVESIADNIRYFYREEDSPSPAGAINHGLQEARGEMVCLMIDGARMVTPRIIEYGLLAFAADRYSAMAVPGYNVGPCEHHYNVSEGYNEDVEKQLLAEAGWQDNGYRLFDIGSIGGANLNGFFHPLMESNCLFINREIFLEIGGADMRFNLPGGGGLNHHIYRAVCIHPKTRYLFLTPGEGSFHQFHGGVSTKEYQDRDVVLKSHRDQLLEIWEGTYKGVRREPLLLGAVTSQSQKHLYHSTEKALKRFQRLVKHDWNSWPDDNIYHPPWRFDS